MATMNPFDLLGDDAEDPAQQLIAAEQQKVAAPPKKVPVQVQVKPAAKAQQTNKPASLPSKPIPPSQAVRESKSDTGRGGSHGVGRGGGRGFGRGRVGAGFNRETPNNENFSSNSGIPRGHALEDGESRKPAERRGGYGGSRGGYRGGRGGGFNNGEVGEDGRPRRTFERQSGTGRGNEFKREGAGRGNWGTQTDEIVHVKEEVTNEAKNVGDEKPSTVEDGADAKKENFVNESEEKEPEPEDKEMTLEEYEKVLAEKRQALETLKMEERKVDAKEFESMQQLSTKKGHIDDVFIKLGSEKDKRKDAIEKEEKAKKCVSINEFLKPADGERFYSSGGRGRGRGRGSRGGFAGHMTSNASAPSIEDPGQFPTLGGK